MKKQAQKHTKEQINKLTKIEIKKQRSKNSYKKSNNTKSLLILFSLPKIAEIQETAYLEEEVSSFCHHKSFIDFYKNFNEEISIGKIKIALQQEKSSRLEEDNEIRNITLVMRQNLALICDEIIRMDINQQAQISLAKIIKYLIRKGGMIGFDPLFQILKACDSIAIQSEIIYALGYKIKNSDELLEESIISKIKGFMNEDIKPEAISFLEIQIKKKQERPSGNSIKISISKPKVSAGYLQKRPDVIVTKTQQKVKVSQKNSKSEEVTINIQNLADALKSRNKNIKQNSTVENLPTIPEKSGNNRSFLSGTYVNVKKLYEIAINTGTLLADDKDKYLVNKFIANSKWFASDLSDILKGKTLFGIFITDRLISAIFCKISKQLQLCSEAISKLCLCIADLDNVKKRVLDSSDPRTIANNIAGCGGLAKQQYANEPQLVKNIADKIFEQGFSKVQTSLLSCSTTYDFEKIDEIITYEISEFRLDAAQAIYNCAIREKQILTKERLQQIQSCLNDPDSKFRGIITKTLCLIDNEHIDYKILFQSNLSELEQNQNTEIAVAYINNQTKDSQRCKELFDGQTILRLSNLLKEDSSLDIQSKVDCCEIINNYLEYTFSEGLNDDELRNCLDIVESISENESKELKTEALKSILLTAEKTKHLPQQAVHSLVNNIDSLDERIANFIVITLGKICENIQEINLDVLSSKLMDDQVVIGEGGDITFEQRTKDNLAFPSISSIIGKVFVETLQKDGRIAENGITHLVAALNSSEKQTQILSAKALSIVSHHQLISESLLMYLREYIGDQIPDISIYTTLAYVEGLNKLIQNKISIFPSHFDILSRIYVFENLRLGEQDFTKEVNDNILQILLSRADKQNFDENIFSIFDHILFIDQENQTIAVNILEKYTSNKYLIPPNTIVALENVLDIPEVQDIALKALENVIQNGQTVNEKVLEIWSDNLYYAEDISLRIKSLKLLDIADNNQDLSDEIFDKLELQRASNVIANNLIDKEEAISYLIIKTDQGQRLPIDGFKSLIGELVSSHSLSILSNIAKNKQAIPDYIIDKLILELDLEQTQYIQIIEIFASIAKNNQNIPSHLLVKLEKFLDNELICDQVLSIFVLQMKNGEKLSENAISRICNLFLTIKSDSVKEELLFAINSIIEQNSIDKNLIKTVLVYGIQDGNMKIVESSINGFRSYVKYQQLDEECIDSLVKLALRANSDESMKESIYSLLEPYKLGDTQKYKLELTRLDVNNSNQYLESISKLSYLFPLLEQNFKDLNSIIEKEHDLYFKVISILLECKNKQDISHELISSIAIFSANTTSIEIKRQCHHLINQIALTGKKLNHDIIQLLVSDENMDFVQSTLGLIAQNQEISLQSMLLLRIDSMKPSVSNRELNKLLKNINQELRKDFELTDTTINKLLMVQQYRQERGNYSNLEGFLNVFVQSLTKQPKYCLNKSLVSQIEQGIISKQISSDVINGYNIIIREKSYLNLDKVIDTLAEIQCCNEDDKLNLAILGCICSAAEIATISEKSLFILEKNIDNSSDNEQIRILSFRGLIAAQYKGQKSEIFNRWCSSVFTKLQKNIRAEVMPDLELLEIVASLKYFDFNKLDNKPQIEWKKELLLYDLLARFKVSDGEKTIFYRNLLAIEQSEQSQKRKSSEQILKAIRSSAIKYNLSFQELNDIVGFVSSTDFETANNILLNSTNSYLILKRKWAEKLLIEKLKQEVSKTYLEKLVSNICNKFNTVLIIQLFDSILAIINLREFQLLLDFVEINRIKTSDIFQENVSVSVLKRSLEIKILEKQIQGSADRLKLKNMLDHLLDKGWAFEQLNALFSHLKSSNTNEQTFKERNLISIIEILYEYKIGQSNHENVQNVLRQCPEDWLKGINQIAVKNNFQTLGQIKSTTGLIEELKNRNVSNQSISKLNHDDLMSQIEQIKSTKLKSKIEIKTDLIFKIYFQFFVDGVDKIVINVNSLIQSESIVEWNHSDIKVWSSIVKCDPGFFNNPHFLVEALAVIKRANFLVTGFHMTDSQILSCLVALQPNQNRGKLLQVATGEGKSTIVSVLAIINGLKGKKIDIITSSPVLAERDAQEKRSLYQIFGLSCACNNDKLFYICGAKDCYKCDIVYGDASQFQFDILREEYSLLGTMAKRKCEFAIVDEVDSMLIDDSSKIARLCSHIAGVDQLIPIYYYLWQRLIFLHENMIGIDGKFYLFFGKISYGQDKIILKYANKKGEQIQIPDLKKYVRLTKDISHIGQFIEGKIEVFLKKHLEDYLEELFEKKVIKIPVNFQEFVNKQKSKWIINAIIALNYQENKHYVIQEGVINPVDFYNTGIVQSSTNWGDGLHQFLQIKHALKVTSETFTTNFLSNMGYFKRYGKNLFGLTGTLGSEKAQEVLSEIYNVDLIYIPSLHQKQYLELTTIVAANKIKWLNEICSSAINEANKERGILIICETIEHAKLIEEQIKQQYREGAIKLYTMNNMNQERGIEKICPREIIIATNLAGRGTDIKTDKIENNGGMHVIVTFMPSNQRVEEQAFGRTARQGKRGTGQLILNSLSLINYGVFIPQVVKDLRNKDEAKTLDDLQKKELKIIEIKDKLFNMFCSLFNKIRLDIRQKSGVWKKFKDTISIVDIPSEYETNLLFAVEEQWSMFLLKIDDGTIPIEQAEKEYQIFNAQILKDYESNNLIKNPFYHIVIANDYVINDSSLAMYHFDQAIKLDQYQSAAAFAGKAWLLLKGKEKFWTSNDQSLNYKQQAIIELDKALALLSEEMASLNAIQSLLQHNHVDIKSDLSKQLILKVNILGTYLNSLQNAASTIKKSQRLIDIKGIIKYQNQDEFIEKDSGDSVTYEKCTDYNTEISQISTSYLGIQRNKEKRINQILGQFDEFEVLFNDLTVREDTKCIIDQAIDTIKAGYLNTQKYVGSNAILHQNYRNISINLKQINAEQLRFILNPDIEIKEATKEEAISQLEILKLPQFCKINLIITLDHEPITILNDLQANDEVKNIIKQCKDDNLRFNLTFINANEISQCLRNEVLQNSYLNIEFQGLNSSTAKNKLNEIESQNISLEITGSKEEIMQVICDPNVQIVEFFNLENNVSEKIYVHEAKKKVSQMEDSIICIKLEDLDISKANNIIDLNLNSSFNIYFMTVTPQAILQGKIEGLINVSFNRLSEIESIKLIPILRKENLDFNLVFKCLHMNQVEEIIEKASLDQENIEISKVKTLSELFMYDTKPILELSGFQSRGIEYLLEINEKRFIPWRSIISVGSLACIQMLIGGVLVGTGFGATTGIGIITEGAADIFTAYRVHSTRQFTWSDYMKQKAVSLTVSAICMGWQSVYGTGKGAANLLVGASEEVLEQAGTNIIINHKTIGSTLVQSGKNLKNLAFKQMGVATGEAAIREGLNKVADSLSHFELEQFKPLISLHIQIQVNDKLYHSNFKSLVSKMYALDSISNSQNLRVKIDRIVAETINSQQNILSKLWDSIGLQICKGVLSDKNYIGSTFSMGLRILGSLNGLYQLTCIIDKVINQLVKKLSQIDKETLQIAQLLHKYCKIEQRYAREIVNILKEEDIIVIQEGNNTIPLDQALHSGSNQTLKKLNIQTFYHEHINPLTFETNIEEYKNYTKPKTSLDKVNFGNYNQYKSKIIQFCKSLHEGTLSVKKEDQSQIMKSVSDQITDQIIRITEGQLISPWSSYGIGCLTTTISNEIQDKLIRSTQIGQQIISEKEKELVNLQADPNSDQTQINYLLKEIKDRQTYTGLLNHEAKKYMIAYSQCENIHYAKQNVRDNVNMKGVTKALKEHAENVRKNKPADVADMFTLATENGIDLKIVDDPNYQLSEQDIAKGTKVVIFTKGSKSIGGQDSIGHYQLLESDGKLIEIQSSGSDCGYAVFAHITGKSINQLRNETASRIEANCKNFSKAIEAQTWIQENYPKEANSILFSGGSLKCIDSKLSIKEQEFLGQNIKRYLQKIDVTLINSIQTIFVSGLSSMILGMCVSHYLPQIEPVGYLFTIGGLFIFFNGVIICFAIGAVAKCYEGVNQILQFFGLQKLPENILFPHLGQLGIIWERFE